MHALCWLNEPNMPEGHEYEVYHATSLDWRLPIFHSHDSYEFHFFIRGDIRVSIETELFHPQPGDMFIYPPGYAHGNIPNDSGQPYERAYFYITPACMKSMSTPECNLQSIFEQAVAQRQFHYHLTDSAFYDLIAQMDQIISIADDEHVTMKLINRCRLNILIATCCHIISMRQYQISRPAPSRISQVLDYINDHLTEPLTTELLSERFFLNKYHLMHEFRDYTNTSIHQYILARRIVLAQQLLLRGVPAQDIGQQCGFRDYAGFYRAFKARVGMTPQAYKRAILPKE